MIFNNRFAERFKKTGKGDWADAHCTVDLSLSVAILSVLDRHQVAEIFLSGEPFDSNSSQWLALAEEVFAECNGPNLSLEQLFQYQTRIHQLALAPFAEPFARTLVDSAERVGWPKAIATLANVPLDAAEQELAVGDEDAVVKEALECELRYHSNDE